MAVRLFSKLRALPEMRGVTYSSAAAPAQLSDFDMQHKTPVIRKQKLIPKAQYGGRHAVTMLPGGGIGPECMGYVRDIFKYIGAPVDFEIVDIDPTMDNDDDVQYAITTIKRNGVCLKGNIETKSEAAYVTSRNVALRNELDMYAYILNCKSYPGVTSRHKDIDVVIIRQNTEGEYAMLEHESVRGVIESMKVVTASNSERVARFAFEFAKRNGRKKVTTVHKANIMKLSDGLFLETSRRIAKEYPEIEHNDMIIDNCCMQLVAKPHQFDVMLMTNLYGSIVSNVVCGILGGAGLLSGRNYGDHYAVFEPGTRNTGTAIAGKNVANPIAMINASVDMLEHLGHHFHAGLIRRAVNKTINVDRILTPDVGGTASSTDVVNAIIGNFAGVLKDNSLTVAAPVQLLDYGMQHRIPVISTEKLIPRAQYGGRHLVTMLPGGGIGPECMGYVRDIFNYIGAPVDFESVNIDPTKEDDDDFKYAISTIKRNGVCLKGNIETKSKATYVTSRTLSLRNALDMYAYIIDCKSYPGISARHKNIDLVIIRQNTEGEYSRLEHESVNGVVMSMKVVSRSNSEKVARFAFEFAKKHGRKKVTTIHKANIMKLSDGLFLETSRRIAKEYPEIEHNDMIIDNCCMQLVAKPHQFDVMLMTNLYGSIVSNVVCGILGGAGLLSGRNYGDLYAVFEPGTRNKGTAIAGKNVANPIAMINASVDMLEHLGHHFHAGLVRRAVNKTVNVDRILTPDVGGTASSTDVVKAIIANVEGVVKDRSWTCNIKTEKAV